MSVHMCVNVCFLLFLLLQLLPGDVMTVVGVFMPTPFTGFKAMKAGLIADTYLDVHDIIKAKKAYTYVVAVGILYRYTLFVLFHHFHVLLQRVCWRMFAGAVGDRRMQS